MGQGNIYLSLKNYLIYIIFFLNRMASDADEVVLCTIKVDASGVLSIHPDFNRGRKAYIAESDVDFARGMQ